MKCSIETERLMLRPWTMDDAEAFYHGWASDPEVTKYLTWNPHQSIEDTKMILRLFVEQYEKPERINFAIVSKETGELIGGIDVVGYLPDGTPAIGYMLRRDQWGKGYMTEACKAMVALLFSLGHKTIRIDAMVENIGSNRVIQKCGGIFVKTEEEERPLKGDRVLINVYLIHEPTR